MIKQTNQQPAQPDAWMRLVLQTMTVAELERELASGALSAAETRWMQTELRTRR